MDAVHLLLSWISEYAGSAEISDPEGLIQVLIVKAQEQARLDDFSRHSADAFARVMSRIVEKVGDKRILLFEKIVNEASLSISHDLLLRAAAEQGKWPNHLDREEMPDEQFISDGKVVDRAIAVWCARVETAIADGSLNREVKMMAILFRHAQLGRDPLPAINAVRKICSTSEGLRAVVLPFADHGANDIGEFSLIWNAKELADLVEADSTLEGKFAALCSQLRSDQVVKYLEERDTKLK